MNRREALTGMALASAAITLPAAAIAKASTGPSRRAWDKAVAEFRHVDSTFNALIDRSDAAQEAAGEAHPRVDRYFDEYRLGMGMSRDRVVYWLHHYALDAKSNIDVQATADEFMAYQDEARKVSERFSVKRLDEACEAYRPTYFQARDALMAVDAPDSAALLVKIQLAAQSLDGDHAESTLADARRLLAAGRA
jgi:hypothetical protein